MPVFNPQHDAVNLQASLAQAESLIVACYCAAWCDTCTKYRPSFDTLANQYPQYVFVWIDIEENPELLGDEDVENFPTVLIQAEQGNLFFGSLPPHVNHLERLMLSLGSKAPPISQGPESLHTLLASAT